MKDASMTPPKLLWHPDGPEYKTAGRRWQGIPAIERTRGGRLYAAWYSGGKGEEPGNFVIVEKSEDGGSTWTEAWLIVRHEDPQVRCFDQCLWMDPLGRLWLTWTQSWGSTFDGRDGVWAALCDGPDAASPTFDAVRRIANGVMMNKPTALSGGEWLFPCAVWPEEYCNAEGGNPFRVEMARELGANVYVTADQGKSFALRGGVAIDGRVFDEHMVVELRDKRLWMLVRTVYGIGQAFSEDNGLTWNHAGPSGHTGPNSRFHIRRLASGRLLLINHLNPTNAIDSRFWKRRDNLAAMLSEDDGKTWIGGLMLDVRSEVSYPDAVESAEGVIYAIHDRERYGAREILLNRFTEKDILAGRLVSPASELGRVINRAGT